jgi:hypothetical protein
MKKLYTILAALLVVGMINAQDWNISDSQFNALGVLTSTTTVDGLTIYAAADKDVTIDENSKTVEGITYTHRMKSGGSGSFTDPTTPYGRVYAFDVDGDKEITVVLQSSNSSEDRTLAVAAGDENSVVGLLDAFGADPSKQSITYTGGATTIYLYSTSSGINIYNIIAGAPTAIASPMADDANVVKTQYFSISGTNAGNNWSALPAGIYIVKKTLDNEQVVTEKISKITK